MGPEIAGVPGSPRVVSREDHFGSWLKQQRELRQISIGYVAARTRIPGDRLLRIEAGLEPLGRDGQGRSTARLLALTVGADPDEASCLLEDPPGGSGAAGMLGQLPWLRWGLLAGAAGLSAVLVWVLADRLLSSEASAEAPPEVVYRPDYVERLLTEDSTGPMDGIDVGAGSEGRGVPAK